MSVLRIAYSILISAVLMHGFYNSEKLKAGVVLIIMYILKFELMALIKITVFVLKLPKDEIS